MVGVEALIQQGNRFRRAGAIALLLLGGCTTLGVPTRHEELAKLRVGVSTEQEIVELLGHPTGGGWVRTGVLDEAREVWSYEYTEASIGGAKLDFLLVFVRRGRYDGHMWFRSTSSYEHTP